MKQYKPLVQESISSVCEPIAAYGLNTSVNSFSPFIPSRLIVKRFYTTHISSGSVHFTTTISRSNNLTGDTSVFVSIINQIDSLKEIYELVNSKMIKRFIASNPDLINDLTELYTEIITRFGYTTPRIELVSDADMPDWKTLFVSININDEFESGMEKLNNLLECWAFQRSTEFKNAVTISIL